MGTIASNLFDCTDRVLYDFAVHHLEEMLDRLTDAGFEIRPRSEAAEEIAGHLPIGPPRIVPGGPARFTPRGQT
jgi:hypothetical protein